MIELSSLLFFRLADRSDFDPKVKSQGNYGNLYILQFNNYDHFYLSHRLIRSLWLEKLRDNFILLIKTTCEKKKILQ